MITNRFMLDASGLLNFEESQTPVDVMDWLDAHKDGFYTCLRGPRSSAALLLLPTIGRIGHQFIVGTVEPPEGMQTCQEAHECMMEDGHCVRNNHAEVNALLRCANLGRSTRHATVYSINKPCYQCTRALITAGIRRIYYRYAVYDEERTINALKVANVEVIQL